MSFSYHNSNNILPQRTIDPAGFGKVAIITGCASGIGLATTQLFLSHNYEVTGVDMHDIDYAKIDDRDQGRFHFHKGDLIEPGECDEVVRICVAKYGRQKIDVLANIAGILDAYAAADLFTDREWERVLMVNLTVPTRMIRAVLPFMKANGGSIINVASKAAVSGAAAGVAYTASKHGLLGVTKNTAWRFHDEGIRCNAVLPGSLIDTGLGSTIEAANFDEASYERQEPVHALQGPKASITASEVANTILYLASDHAKSINGISLPIDRAWGVI